MTKPSITIGDTGGLISLAIPIVAPKYDHESDAEPFGLFLTNYDVTVPRDVFDELYGLASQADGTLLGDGDPPSSPTSEAFAFAAASVVTAAEGSGYEGRDAYTDEGSRDEPPDWKLDDGEIAAIVQANRIEADSMVSDDFKSETEICKHLDDSVEWLSSFDVLVEMKENDLLTKTEGREVADVIVDAREWEQQPDVQAVILRHL